MDGWKRRFWLDETDAPWVMPSPNMPTCDTALVYPGMCLVEGTELSEGRGTTRPFELAGAPFLEKLADLLRREVDSDKIDATGEIPDALIARLADIGAFGIKVPREYGGLGLSQTNYCRAAQLLGGVDANLTAQAQSLRSLIPLIDKRPA